MQKSELFSLIKALTKSEKRYFKLYAKGFSGQESTYYEVLFDALDKQKEYKHAKTLNALRKAGAKMEIAVLKRYLFDLILKSLAAYNSNKDIDAQLSSLISNANILMNKKLFKPAVKSLKKARGMAQMNERFLRLLEINRFEQLILQQKGDLKSLESSLQASHIEELGLIEKEKNARQFRSLALENFINYYKTPAIRNNEDLIKHSKAINTPLIANNEASTNYSRYILHNISGQYYEACMNYDKLYQHTLKTQQIFMANEAFKNTETKFYISSCSNHILACVKLRKSIEAENTISLMRVYAEEKLKKINPLYFEATMHNAHLLSLFLKFWTFDFNSASLYYKHNLKKITESPVPYVKENEFLLFGALSLFYSQKYDDALDACLIIINKPIAYSDYVNSVTRFLNLIIHYEMNHYSLLDHLITSSYRFLLKRKEQFKTENIIMNLIKKLAGSIDKKETKKHLIEAHEKLIKLKNDPFEKKAFEYLDYEIWVRSKIEKCPITEILKNS